jgi:hypothetical protein
MRGEKGDKGDKGEPATRLWAVVSALGSLVRGSGVTGVTKPGDGQYEVAFSQNVTACGWVATIGDPGTAVVFAPGVISTSRSASNASAIRIETKTPPGGLTDFPFHLAVLC